MKALPAPAPLVIDVERPIGAGILFVAIGFFGFLLWAALAPITSAAVAPGVIVADSRNKDIQHLEGGLIHEVLVREGERVEIGETLVRLVSASADATLGRLQATRRAALAAEARLIAERDGLAVIGFPAELTMPGDRETAEICQGQRALFEASRKARDSEQAILRQRIAQYQEEITGIEAQVAAGNSQIGLLAKETSGVKTLADKGLATKTRLLALQRASAGLTGQRGENVARIARVRQNIAEMDERLINLTAQHASATASELRDTQAKLADIREQIAAAADASRRLDVTAPVSGRVVSIFKATPGGVVRPGETIMELLPDHDQLVVEARVRPEDIDDVAPEARARVRLTAYSQRRTSSLSGHIQSISADRLVDPQTDRAYFLARVLVDAESLTAQRELKLYPGMSAIVYIEGGRRSLLDYLLGPLFDGIDGAFRES